MENSDSEVDTRNSSDEAEIEPVPKEYLLSKADIAEGLSQLARTADGISHAFVRLEVRDSQITDISAVSSFIHIRYLDCSNNSITSLKPLSSLEHLVALNLEGNLIESLADLGHSKLHVTQQTQICHRKLYANYESDKEQFKGASNSLRLSTIERTLPAK
jgi:Leucine-rich repeat (LRR) protein